MRPPSGVTHRIGLVYFNGLDGMSSGSAISCCWVPAPCAEHVAFPSVTAAHRAPDLTAGRLITVQDGSINGRATAGRRIQGAAEEICLRNRRLPGGEQSWT